MPVMHALLERASVSLGLELPALASAAEFSERQIQEARLWFGTRLAKNNGLDIVVCGSMARREMSTASDFDYLVVAHGLIEDASGASRKPSASLLRSALTSVTNSAICRSPPEKRELCAS